MAIFEQKRRKKDQKMIARNNNLFIYIYIKYDNNFLSLFQREKASANVLRWVLPDVFLGQQKKSM